MAEAAAGAGGGMGADMGGGGGGGGGMEDLASMMGGGAPEEGGEEAPPEEGGEEDMLLAAPDEVAPPGRREDGYYTPNSKGKPYFPVTYDKRKDAGRAKNYVRKVSPEVSKRTLYPGWSGTTGLRSVAKGLFEEQESIYEGGEVIEERKLFETNNEVRRLVENLEGLERTKK